MFDAPILSFDVLDSTMLEARRRAERGELSAVWLVTARQEHGRGRRGRAWASIDGNLMTTFVGATSRPPAELALVGFAAGLAIAESFEAFGADGVTLKWPNDVFICGAKAAGLMLDSGAGWMALGIGANLAGAPEVDQKTTSLAQAAGVAVAPLAFLEELAPRLAHWDARLLAESFAPLRAAWTARAHGLGRAARVAVGERIVEGVLSGLSERGELELETAAGVTRIAAGDILLPAHEAA